MHHHGHPIAGSLVRARNSRGTVVGVGFLAAPGLVCTCAHVITEALDLPDEQPTPPVDEVTLDFPFVSDATVRAVVARWLPIQSAGGGDIAILRVTTVVPASTAPVSLLVERNLAGRHVEVHGISERADDDRWTEGIVGHRLPNGWVQLEGTAITGYRVQPGFSGAPVWDPEAHGVVGMVVAADQEPTTEIAFLIPASWLIEAEPTLDHAPSMRAVYPRVAHVGPIGSAAPSLPSGTVAFLFTDIEGSTRLWEKDPRAMAVAVARHDALLRATITAHRGHVFKTVGDAFYAAFRSVTEALAAAIDAQRTLAAEPWQETGPLRVRMALHVSEAEERDADYFGQALNRLARLLATGHGNQILLSASAHALVRTAIPADVRLLDLGEHRLKDLLHPEHVYQVMLPDLPANFPPLKSLDYIRHNLPVQLTPFVGRERQVSDVTSMLLNPAIRLVTLTGPGGTGKTRIGLEVAATLSDAFPDGVWFVPLVGVTDPDTVASTIVSTLEVREGGEEPDVKRLTDHLQDQQVLLLLDNFEHLLQAAPLVAELLMACPTLNILVTSREGLMISGEHVYPVPTMQLPPRASPLAVNMLTEYEGIRLFIARASEKMPDFTLSEANALAVVEICHRLDGLPLAIELAAARVGYYPSLLDLQTRLAQRLLQLKRRAPDLPERLRTMQASIAWSYNLLDPGERAIFRRFAIFSGGCTIEAAEAVCTSDDEAPVEVMDGLASLIDKSLVQPETGVEGSRYRMLETIREFGLGELAASAEEVATRQRHATYFVAVAERAAPELDGPAQSTWLDRLEADRDNLRAALEWTLGQEETDLELRLAVALQPFWQIRGYLREGYDWLERALATEQPVDLGVRASALHGLGRLAFDLGDYARAPGWFEESLHLRRQLGDRRAIADTLTNLGFAVAARREHDRARALHEEAQAIWRELGDTRGVAMSLYRLGDLAQDEGDYRRARTLYHESLAKYREPEDALRIANLHWALGATARLEGDGNAAARSAQQSLALFRRVGNKIGIGNALLELGHAARLQGDDRQAEHSYADALTLFTDLGSKPGMVEGLEALAGIAAAHGRMEFAAKLLGTATSWRKILDQPFVPAADQVALERLVSTVRTEAEAAFAAGQAISLDDAVAAGLVAPTFPQSDPGVYRHPTPAPEKVTPRK